MFSALSNLISLRSGGSSHLQPDPIHLVLTDIVMPGINGKELAERLAATRPYIKMIFMSGRAAEVLGNAGELISADTFLAKPFTPARLLNKVRTRLAYRSPFSRQR